MRGEEIAINGAAVRNVLVQPGMADDATDIERRAGETIAYTLRLPSTGDLHSGDRVTVRGHECRVEGFSDAYDAAGAFGSAWSLPWTQTALVSLCEGDMTAEIAVVRLVSTIDALGDAQTERVDVWSGAAQARREDPGAGDEGTATTRQSTTEETWQFVMPWNTAFSDLRPPDTLVAWQGTDYDVAAILDVDQKGETAVFTGVRRG